MPKNKLNSGSLKKSITYFLKSVVFQEPSWTI